MVRVPRLYSVFLFALATMLGLAHLEPAYHTVGAPIQSDHPGQRFEIGLIGDLLYTPEELEKWPNLMADMDAAPLAFVVHDGDFKSGSSRCDDVVFEDRLQRFQASAHPFIYIPGDNEWTDCHRENNGAYDPIERLEKLRAMFFPGNESLGQRRLRLERQSDDPAYAKFRENVRWSFGDVMFVGLNVQGSNNNFGRTPEQDEEFYERDAANIVWLNQAFARAKAVGHKGIMIIIQANMFEDEPREGPNGFAEFKRALEVETLAFPGPVVLVHGDSHTFRIDKPLRASTTGRRIENFTRVETFGTPDSHWVKAIIDPSDPQVFTFKPMIVQANVVNHTR